MLEAQIRSRPLAGTLLLLIVAGFFSSCATEQPHTALVSDPDSRTESSIPWNKPAKWETGANIPGGLGGAGAGGAGQPGGGGY
jgi:hypothetical protein